MNVSRIIICDDGRVARRNDEGLALLLVVILTLLVMAGVGLVVGQAVTAKHHTDMAVARYSAEEVGKAGIDWAIERLWGGYLQDAASENPSVSSFLDYLDRMDSRVDGGPISLLPEGGLVLEALDGERREVVGLDMLREPIDGGVRLTVTATAEVGIFAPVRIEQVVEVTGKPLVHPDYALLGDNLSCVMCHSQIRSLPLELNHEPQYFNTFDRVKVASLKSLLVRGGTGPFAANTDIAGTVYTRGDNILNEGLLPFTETALARSTFRGFEIDPVTGALVQDQFGNMQDVPFVNARMTDDGLPVNSNLYYSYATDENSMSDGVLPTAFPGVFPDRNGDRKISDDEFDEGAETATGSLTGGLIYGVPRGSTYGGAVEHGLPEAGNMGSVQQVLDGNAILVGQPGNPLVIQDEVAIDGDLVIQGTVKGTGRVSVRGNVYVVGDVTYDDASDTFGVAADGTKNGLAIVAGGNILVGDYLTRRAKSYEDTGSAWKDLFIDVRESSKAVPSTRDDSEAAYKDVGYFADDVVDPGRAAISTEGFLEDNMGFASAAISQFNQRELSAFTQGDSDATTPRFYTLRDESPLYVYTGHTNEALGYTMYYTNPFLETLTPADAVFSDAGVVPTVLSLGPTDDWLSEDHLRQFWYDDELGRTDAGEPLQFDGLLYSSNAIIGVVRSKDLHNSNTYGQMVVRGAINAPDVAILAPGANRQASPRDALTLLYDPRVADFRLQDPNTAVFRRTLFRYVAGPEEG